MECNKKQEEHLKNLLKPRSVSEESNDSPEVLFAPISILSEQSQRARARPAEPLEERLEAPVLMESLHEQGRVLCGVSLWPWGRRRPHGETQGRESLRPDWEVWREKEAINGGTAEAPSRRWCFDMVVLVQCPYTLHFGTFHFILSPPMIFGLFAYISQKSTTVANITSVLIGFLFLISFIQFLFKRPKTP